MEGKTTMDENDLAQYTREELKNVLEVLIKHREHLTSIGTATASTEAEILHVHSALHARNETKAYLEAHRDEWEAYTVKQLEKMLEMFADHERWIKSMILHGLHVSAAKREMNETDSEMKG